MDAILRLFEPHLDTDLIQLRVTLKELMRSFGAVRDLDLQLADLAKFAADLPLLQGEALQPLRRRLEGQHAEAREKMLQLLDAPSTDLWRESLSQLLGREPNSHRATVVAAAAAPGPITPRFRKMRNAADRLSETSTLDDHHQVRIRIKKLRYAIEALAPLYGPPADEILRTLRKLQDSLGQMQDAHVASSQMLELATSESAAFAPLTAFVMGRYAERREMSIAGARNDFAKGYGNCARNGRR
jgi:CHAD domain-containing protein